MCEKCRPLAECHVGEKRHVEVEQPAKPEIVDFYGRTLTIGPVVMAIDKWPDGNIDCSIYQDMHDENDVGYGTGFDIKCCPYCGERLVKE